jgi:hypothetical protein
VNEAFGPISRSNNVSLTSVGLTVIGDLSFEDWMEMIQTLVRVDTACQFAIGDALIWGESRYGEKYSQAMEWTGLSYQALANMVWVAKKVPLANRVEGLSWTHHRVVASLDQDDQLHWLEYANSQGISAHAMQHEISGKEPVSRDVVPIPSGLTASQATTVLKEYAAAVNKARSGDPDTQCSAEDATALSSILCKTCPHRTSVV